MVQIDTFFLDRIRDILRVKRITWIEKRMFGGLSFMVDGKMCFGAFQGGMMARVAPEEMEALKKREGVRHMQMGERPMKGYLYLEPEAFDQDDDLAFWIQKCLDFNPRAKASKKRKKKT